jgi:hypothetical protein
MITKLLNGFGSGGTASSYARNRKAKAVPRPTARDWVDDSEAVVGEGLIEGTFIACENGWRPVGAITVGDLVMTFDNGLQPVTELRRSLLWTTDSEKRQSLQHLEVPRKALGNLTPMRLLPEQRVLLESDAAEALHGDPFVLVPAAALEGYRGITRVVPYQPTEIFSLGFDREEVIYANGASLVHCACLADATVTTPEELMYAGSDSVYPKLSQSDVCHLVACLHREDARKPIIRQAAMPFEGV